MRAENLVKLLSFLVEKDECSVLMFYSDAYSAFMNEKMSKELWDKYCMRCLEELMRKNKDVLEKLKKFDIILL